MPQTLRFGYASKKVLFGLLGAATWMVATPALAAGGRGAGKTHIAVDFDFTTAVDEDSTDSGGGGALRLGQKYDLLLVSLTPELGGGYHGFGGGSDAKLYSGFIGGRLGIGKIIEPSVFGHVGLGRLEGVAPRTAPLLDAGVALDLTILPLIDLGLHGAYNVMMPKDDGTALKFVTLGAHAALVF
ncbi:MAG: hypothetical protein EOO73_07830 [Myxococcales bacterium]|nr:MAG: hypothetical protein EOO73_07830 [Myxococcales bacterium]